MTGSPDLFEQALTQHRVGRLDEAAAIYRRVLASEPRHFDALHLLGVIYAQRGNPTEAVRLITAALAVDGDAPQALNNLGLALQALGRTEEALTRFERACALDPAYAAALHNRATMLRTLGRNAEALPICERVLALRPDWAEAQFAYGTALHILGRNEEALAACSRALELQPAFPQALGNRSSVLRMLKRPADALHDADAALALQPGDTVAMHNRGTALKDLGRYQEAFEAFSALIAHLADPGDAFHNRALVLHALKRYEEALADYNRAVALKPGALLFSDRASVHLDLLHWDSALADADRALALAPDLADGHYNRGTALQHLGRWQEALAAFDAAIARKPSLALAHYNRGLVLQELNRVLDARKSFDTAVVHKPDYSEAAYAAFVLSCQLCEWDTRQERIDDLVRRTRAGQTVTPFVLLTAVDDPALHKLAAENFARRQHPGRAPLFNPVRMPGARIRVAYVSADFHYHATAQLIARLIELHDRNRFEIVGVSLEPSDGGPLRARLESAFDRVLDATRMTDEAVARAIADMGVDIAVDLKGYTKNYRMGIFAHRPAPVAVSYLGYPGTTGAPYIDYFLADRFTVPTDARADFSEKVVYLPECYQVNDPTKVIAEPAPSRASLGLPENAFVFCALNNAYKITPDMFAVWMGLLGQTPDSVLWLYADTDLAKRNLGAAARDAGIAAERLVFADFAPLAEHLSRMRAADLFLDTFPVCAHTTASEALWAGVPLLTCAGRSFVSRVAGSLLTTQGVPELVTSSLAQYAEVAAALTREPERLRTLRTRIAANRDSAPLFDCARFRRYIERAFVVMAGRHRDGLPPESFAVEPQ